jgi:hypothetical protein
LSQLIIGRCKWYDFEGTPPSSPLPKEILEDKKIICIDMIPRVRNHLSNRSHAWCFEELVLQFLSSLFDKKEEKKLAISETDLAIKNKFFFLCRSCHFFQRDLITIIISSQICLCLIQGSHDLHLLTGARKQLPQD